VRQRWFAHVGVANRAETSTSWSKGTHRELQRLFMFMASLHKALWQLFYNGRKPVLRPVRYAMKSESQRSQVMWMYGNVFSQTKTKFLPEALKEFRETRRSSRTAPDGTNTPAPVWRSNFATVGMRKHGRFRAGLTLGMRRACRWLESPERHKH